MIRVKKVEPDGPAAQAGLLVGDIIIVVDGHDVRGSRSYLYKPLVNVPEGRSIVLKLERGETITIEAGEAPKTKFFM
jgi:C-terminal processing protease CtpA/Prc